MKFLKNLPHYLLIAFIFIEYPSVNAQVNPVFQTYYNEYISLISKNCDHSQYRYPLIITIRFDDLTKQGYVGLTMSYDYEFIVSKAIIHYSDITIDERDWNRSNDDDRFALIVHELTHAYFNYPDLKQEKNRGNFMYYSKEPLKRKDVQIQLKELLGILCHK